MEGVHDLGGLHGFGSVATEVEEDEPVFHGSWEGRILGLMIVAGAKRLRSETFRAYVGAMPPADYLAASYYERWAFAVEAALVEGGALTRDEIDARAAADPPPLEEVAPRMGGDDGFTAHLVGALQRTEHGWPAAPAARFGVGDRVTVRRMAPVEHHRCPRYVRGVAGTVTRVAGGFPRPDGTDPSEALYTVRFDMADLWGEDAEPGSLFVDLWEGYLT